MFSSSDSPSYSLILYFGEKPWGWLFPLSKNSGVSLISQIIKRERERIAFRGTCSLEVMLVHHCRVSSLGLHCCGHRAGCAVQDATRLHTLLVKRHSTRRWKAVSEALRQRGQEGLCGHPLRCSLSEFHTQFWVTSQAKNLHLGGAQALQILCTFGALTLPINCAL